MSKLLPTGVELVNLPLGGWLTVGIASPLVPSTPDPGEIRLEAGGKITGLFTGNVRTLVDVATGTQVVFGSSSLASILRGPAGDNSIRLQCNGVDMMSFGIPSGVKVHTAFLRFETAAQSPLMGQIARTDGLTGQRFRLRAQGSNAQGGGLDIGPGAGGSTGAKGRLVFGDESTPTPVLNWSDNALSFFDVGTPITKPAVTGSRGGNAALASLLTQLAALGLVTDNTTA